MCCLVYLVLSLKLFIHSLFMSLLFAKTALYWDQRWQGAYMTLSGNYLGLVFFVFGLPYYWCSKTVFQQTYNSKFFNENFFLSLERWKLICEKICISLMNKFWNRIILNVFTEFLMDFWWLLMGLYTLFLRKDGLSELAFYIVTS